MIKFLIDYSERHQTIRSFGASGAWWAQLVGTWDEDDGGIPKRDRIAQLLYDRENGIGMTGYRYNLGGGSQNSKKGNIPQTPRRAESFDSEGGYDFTRDAAAVEMMKSCVKAGADEVTFFVNSPPESLTVNGMSHCDKAGKTNLDKKNYKAFAKYCLDVTEHFLLQGLPVKYLSPINEPVWVWLGGQEGCHYSPKGAYGVFKAFANELENRPELDKKIRLAGAENGDIRWYNHAYTAVMLGDKKIRSRIDSVDTHSYFLGPQGVRHLTDRRAYMTRYRKFVDTFFPGTDLVTSEWCHMLGGRHYGMDSALEQAKVMYEDLSVLDVVSWQLWIACSDVDYCDGLIYIFPETHGYKLTKRYYAFGNFSKFIRPGDVRIGLESTDKSVSALAFTDGKTLKIIAINPSDYSKTVSLPGYYCGEKYVTDSGSDLEKSAFCGRKLNLTPQSVTTLLLKAV